MTEIPEKRSYLVKEVALYFGIPAGTLRRWMSTGRLPHFHIGRQARIQREYVLKIQAGEFDFYRSKRT